MKPDRLLLGALALTVALSACGGSQSRSRVTIQTHTVTPTAIPVPSLGGETIGHAQAALRNLGLIAKVVRTSSSTPAGRVIRTNPPGFASAQPGETVDVFVSNGPPRVKLPELVGESQAAAVRTATGLGLVVVVVEQMGPGRAGDVSGQSPAAKSSVLRGSTIQLTVPVSLSTVSLPGVVGESEETAVATLSGLGLTIAFKAQSVTHLIRDHLVLAQSPAAGARLAKGSRVTLTVGVYK